MKKNLINIFKVSSDNFEADSITETILLKSLKRGGTVFIDINNDLIENFNFSPNLNKRTKYISPTLKNTIAFNPLAGEENYMIENFTKIINELNYNFEQNKRDSETFVIKNSLKVLKRLHGNNLNMLHLAELLLNCDGNGRKVATDFYNLKDSSSLINKENTDLSNWFLNEYFGGKNHLYDIYSGVRSQIIDLVSNEYLKRILIPSNENKEVNLGKHLTAGGNIIINLSQDLIGEINSNFLLLMFFNQLKDTLLQSTYIDEEINIFINHSEKIMSTNAINSMILGRNYEEHKISIDKVQINFPCSKSRTTKKNIEKKKQHDTNIKETTITTNLASSTNINTQLPNKREDLIEISNNLLKEKKDKLKQEQVINWNDDNVAANENLLLEEDDDEEISCESRDRIRTINTNDIYDDDNNEN